MQIKKKKSKQKRNGGRQVQVQVFGQFQKMEAGLAGMTGQLLKRYSTFCNKYRYNIVQKCFDFPAYGFSQTWWHERSAFTESQV